MTLSIGSLHPNHGGLVIFMEQFLLLNPEKFKAIALSSLHLSLVAHFCHFMLIFLLIEIITHFLMFEYAHNYLSFT